MLVKEIVDSEKGTKWEIYKESDDNYYGKYYEFFQSCGWKFMWQDGGNEQGYYSKECIEYDFDIKVA